MPSMLNRFLIASPAQWEKVGRNAQELRRHPSGTGPWKLKSFTPQQQAELVRNEDYWDNTRVPKSERMLLFGRTSCHKARFRASSGRRS
jgi:ABC-type transport system substrate-binding protein